MAVEFEAKHQVYKHSARVFSCMELDQGIYTPGVLPWTYSAVGT